MKTSIFSLLFSLILTGINAQNQPKVERHEFVARGNHQNELPMGTYVVYAAFKTEESAKQLLAKTESLLSKNPTYGYLSIKQYWVLVGSPATDDIESAKLLRNDMRKMQIFKDAWLLTVHQ